MNKALKVFGIIILILVIFGVGLKLYFNNERLKGMVMPYVDEAVGRPVQVDQLSLAFFRTFPHVGVSIKGMTIPGEKQDTLFTMDEMLVSVDVIPLLSSKLNISELDIRNPRFTYKVYADSSSNLDFILNQPADTAASGGAMSVNIPYLSLTGGQFGYQDATSDTRIRVNDLDADVSLSYADLINTDVKLDIGGLSATVGGTSYIGNLPVSLNEQSTLDMKGETLDLKDGTFSIRGLALKLNGTVRQWSSGQPQVDLQFSSSSDNFGELLKLAPEEYQKQIGSLDTRGSLALNGQVKGAVGGEQLPAFNLDISVKDGYMKDPDLPQAIDDIQIAAKADNDRITIDRLHAKAGTNLLDASGSILKPLEERRSYDLQLKADADLSTVKDFYPISEDTLALRGQLTAEARIKGQADDFQKAVQSGKIKLSDGYVAYKKLGKPLENITLDASLKGARLTLNKASLTTGGNKASATGWIDNYAGGKPDINLTLNGDFALAQVNDYYSLKPLVSEMTGSSTLNLTVKGPAMEPARLTLDGALQLSGVNITGDSLPQPIRNLNARLEATPQSMSLKQFTARIGASDFDTRGSLKNYMAFLQEDPSQGPVPELSGSNHSRMINLDQYIDWDAEDDTTAVYLIDLPNLDSSVEASVDTLLMTGVPVTQIKAKASTTPERITLEKASARIFKGDLEGSFVWKAPQPDRTNIDFKGEMKDVRAEEFFREFPVLGKKSKFHEYITGGFNAKVDYYTAIDKHLSPLIKTTRAQGSFGMTKLRIKNSPIQEKVAALLNAPELNNLALDQWESQFTMDDGILTLKNLKLTSDDYGVELNGTQNMITDRIDYKLRLYLPGGKYEKTLASILSKEAVDALKQENGRVMLPLTLKGTSANPKVAPDKDVITSIVKEYLKKKAGKVLKGIFDGIKH